MMISQANVIRCDGQVRQRVMITRRDYLLANQKGVAYLRLGRRKQFLLVDIYDELLNFGHTDIWLREVNPPNLSKRLLVSCDNNVLASYMPLFDRWLLCKKSRLVNPNPTGINPPGPGLTLLDRCEVICLMTIGY